MPEAEGPMTGSRAKKIDVRGFVGGDRERRVLWSKNGGFIKSSQSPIAIHPPPQARALRLPLVGQRPARRATRRDREGRLRARAAACAVRMTTRRVRRPARRVSRPGHALRGSALRARHRLHPRECPPRSQRRRRRWYERALTGPAHTPAGTHATAARPIQRIAGSDGNELLGRQTVCVLELRSPAALRRLRASPLRGEPPPPPPGDAPPPPPPAPPAPPAPVSRPPRPSSGPSTRPSPSSRAAILRERGVGRYRHRRACRRRGRRGGGVRVIVGIVDREGLALFEDDARPCRRRD